MCPQKSHIFDQILQTVEGNNYVLSLVEISLKDYLIEGLEEMETPVFELTLTLSNQKPDEILPNNPATFYKIGCYVLDFLLKNDVIVYYYCDVKDINKSKKHSHISNQEYRHLLFKTMFNYVATKRNITNYADNDVEIVGDGEIHYVHFICSPTNQPYVDILKSELQKLNK